MPPREDTARNPRVRLSALTATFSSGSGYSIPYRPGHRRTTTSVASPRRQSTSSSTQRSPHACLVSGSERSSNGEEPTPAIPRDGTFLGALFESLVTLDVRVYAQAAEARVGHLRSFAGEHEVDLIVERDDARVVAIEVKLAATVDDGAVRHLRWLQDRLGTDLLDAIVITTGSHAYRRPDGIGVVPAALLGP